MQQQEKSQAYRCIDYMSSSTSLCPDGRLALCNWGYKTVAACDGIRPATAVTAISHFGLFMGSNSRSVELARADIGTAQLAFVTCLVIVLKTHSGFNVRSDFVSNTICRDMYCADEIIQMELEILQSLQWRLNGPLPHDFINSFLQVVIPFVDSRHLNFLTTCSKGFVE
jgi:hypothetical protein